MQFIKEDERLAIAEKRPVLVEALGFTRGYATSARDLALIVAGVGALVLAANIRVPMWPVPVTMQTLAVLMIGAGYGLRLGLVTVLAYLALGAAGVAVFAGESAGLAYGGADRRLSRRLCRGGGADGGAGAARLGPHGAAHGAAMILGNAAIYACGLAWMSALFAADKGMGWVLQYGMVNFLPGDALKIALAAMLMPLLWRAVKR